ncbi:MAG: hypothetical protein AB2A00_22030 [Myxococcota bacterium]
MAKKTKNTNTTTNTTTNTKSEPARAAAPVTTTTMAKAATPVPTTTTAPAKAATTTTPAVNMPAATDMPARPVEVRFEPIKTGLKATIRYAGPLARTEKLLARVGFERANSPRWQAQRDVEMRRVKEGLFEADLTVPVKDDRGADLMALQLAFQAPTTHAWDSAGMPGGYYQVSALTGAVERVPH